MIAMERTWIVGYSHLHVEFRFCAWRGGVNRVALFIAIDEKLQQNLAANLSMQTVFP